MRTRRGQWVMAVVGAAMVAGCAGRNTFVHTHNFNGHIGGFFAGIWHGLWAPLSLLGSLVMDINIYEVHNTGFFYNAGFLLGVSLWPWLITQLRTQPSRLILQRRASRVAKSESGRLVPRRREL